MADERVDPFERLTPYALDHLARYLWARQLIGAGLVLDAACGTGFGTRLLSEGGRRQVLGVDISEDAVVRARHQYGGAGVDFAVMDLLGDLGGEEGQFDAIVSFETLEHLPDPDKALGLMKRMLKPDGILLASVPGDADVEDDNPYHLQHFTRESFKALVMKHFEHVCLFTQCFHVSSLLNPEVEERPSVVERLDEASGVSVAKDGMSGWLLDNWSGEKVPPDTRLLIASAGPIPECVVGYKLESREVWLAIRDEMCGLRRYQKSLEAHTADVQQHCRRLEEHNRQLEEHCRKLEEHNRQVEAFANDMQDKFVKTLGWGTFYKNLAQEAGIDPEAVSEG